MSPAPALDRYAVIGNPVAHSQSPFIHEAFAQQTGQAMRYERLLCPIDGFAAALRDFAATGALGCNVTVPFKFEALRLAQRISPRAERAGAANTLRFDADGWLADNTDGVGLRRDIESNAGVALAGRRVLLIGAGGAGAGVLGPLIEAAPAALVLANRSVGKAEALAERHADLARSMQVDLSTADLGDPGRGFDLVVNATASSLQGVESPVPSTVLSAATLVVDLMYGSAAEPFLNWARAHGATARDGLGMLVEQAAASFCLWRGTSPKTAPVLQALRDRMAQAA